MRRETRVLVRSHPSISLPILLLVNVTRLIRVSFGDYKLDTIPPGMAIEVPYKPVEGQRRKGSLALLPRRLDRKAEGGRSPHTGRERQVAQKKAQPKEAQ
jgi:hypothetical protein